MGARIHGSKLSPVDFLLLETLFRAGAEPVLEQSLAAMEFTRIASSLGLLFGGRRPWVYWATVILLGIQTALIPKKIFILPDHLLGGQIALSIVGLFFLLLFYKFTFGKSTRAYFKVASTRDLPLTPRIPPAP